MEWKDMALCLALYDLLPFLRWDRGTGQPDQAVLFDVERIRFHFFFVELWHNDLILLTGAPVLATLVLILVNALVGRAWCGFACPQTVWSDLFMLVERRVEGDRRTRLRLLLYRRPRAPARACHRPGFAEGLYRRGYAHRDDIHPRRPCP
ncbi:MAG: 4Fe-4S binding protein [Salinarimonas sp.]